MLFFSRYSAKTKEKPGLDIRETKKIQELPIYPAEWKMIHNLPKAAKNI